MPVTHIARKAEDTRAMSTATNYRQSEDSCQSLSSGAGTVPACRLAVNRRPWYKLGNGRSGGRNSVGRVSASQAGCRGFESHRPLPEKPMKPAKTDPAKRLGSSRFRAWSRFGHGRRARPCPNIRALPHSRRNRVAPHNGWGATADRSSHPLPASPDGSRKSAAGKRRSQSRQVRA